MSPSGLVSQQLPDLPFVQERLCPFELGCAFGQWTALQPLVAFTSLGDTLSSTILIGDKEVFTALWGDMVTYRIGLVEVRDSVHSYAPGDTIYVLSYAGEGIYSIWQEDHVESQERFWADSLSPGSFSTGNLPAALVRRTVESWWVRIETDDGQTAWIPFPYQRLCGVQAQDWAETGKC